ncbi:MAG: ABC transporter permease subunit [Verrucomicrobiota bacterium]
MPILSPIGRKNPRVRFLLACMYGVLVLGSLTMVYPFLIMLSGSTKSAVDVRDFDVVPRFLSDDPALYRKHIEGLFNESLDMMNMTYDSDASSFQGVEPPGGVNDKLVDEWTAFLATAELPDYAVAAGYVAADVSRTIPQGLREFKQFAAARFGPDLRDVNNALGTDFVGWNAFAILPENYLLRVRMPPDTPLARALSEFKKTRNRGDLFYPSPEGFFKRLYLKSIYTRDIGEYNRAHGTAYRSYGEVHLARRAPAGNAVEREDWESFVRGNLNLLWVRADPGAAPVYRAFLKAKYDRIGVLNRNYGTAYRSFADVPLIQEPPLEGVALSDWAAVISGWKDPADGREYRLPAESLRAHSAEFMFRDYLQRKYGSVESINSSLGTTYADFAEIVPPQKEAHWRSFLDRRRALRWEFVTRNYRAVFDYVAFHGRGVLNTAIYCSLAVFFALLVNPLAAYALSRFKMPSAYKILLFLMLTMAFPSMVTQIPVFLMLRKFHLLNTFAALILPGLANGYSIFLLKGFFDSLPRDLYESAQLDGAGEWTMFWRITMRLSTPILSVIALQAFVAAYANFMYALLICQDERMWTLMVWLYQLQERSGQAVVYASLVVAAIPTFIIFVLCQRVILRGIVVPVER